MISHVRTEDKTAFHDAVVLLPLFLIYNYEKLIAFLSDVGHPLADVTYSQRLCNP